MRLPGAEVTDGYELPDVGEFWELNSGPLERLQAILSTETSLQPLLYVCSSG